MRTTLFSWYFTIFFEQKSNETKKTYILGNPFEVVLVLPSSSANPVDMNITRSKPKRNHFSPRSGVIISINDVRGAWISNSLAATQLDFFVCFLLFKLWGIIGNTFAEEMPLSYSFLKLYCALRHIWKLNVTIHYVYPPVIRKKAREWAQVSKIQNGLVGRSCSSFLCVCQPHTNVEYIENLFQNIILILNKYHKW